MTVRSRSPLRVSFGGGGTDVSPYLDERGGAVLSATIDRYAYATIETGEDLITVESLDYDVSIAYALDEQFVYDGQLDLAKAVIDHFRADHGLRGVSVRLHNDAPPGSGLGSSSAICVALSGALAEHLGLKLDPHALAELAYRIERVDAGIRGGKQDQYATAFGGLNFIEFDHNETRVERVALAPATLYELQYALVFAYVGGQHFSSHIIERQIGNLRSLEKGDVAAFGSLLHEGWQAKKRMAEGISNPRIDAVYDTARAAGALGGKISGAGGGGFMFFVTDPRRRFAVQDALREQGAELVNFTFVEEGMRAWNV